MGSRLARLFGRSAKCGAAGPGGMPCNRRCHRNERHRDAARTEWYGRWFGAA